MITISGSYAHNAKKNKCSSSPWFICEVLYTKSYDALRDLVQFVKFKKFEKRPWRSVTFFQIVQMVKYRAKHYYVENFIVYSNLFQGRINKGLVL